MIGTSKLCAHFFPPFFGFPKCIKFLEQLLLIAFWILFPLNFLSKNWILNYSTTITICLPNHRFLNDPLFMTTQPFFALLHRHVHTIHIHKYTKTDYHLFSPSKQSFKKSCFCLALWWCFFNSKTTSANLQVNVSK